MADAFPQAGGGDERDGGSQPGALPVFMRARALPSNAQGRCPNTYEICSAAEKKTGYGSIRGSQNCQGIIRLLPWTEEARTTLLLEGFTYRGVHVETHPQSPRAPRQTDGQEEDVPTTKVIISNIPISFNDRDIEQTLVKLGCSVKSKILEVRVRDENKRLTNFINGQRYAFIAIPDRPLPDKVKIGPFTGYIYHKEQKEQSREEQREANATCRNCLTRGHSAKNCSRPIVCRGCGAEGHRQSEGKCKDLEETLRDLEGNEGETVQGEKGGEKRKCEGQGEDSKDSGLEAGGDEGRGGEMGSDQKEGGDGEIFEDATEGGSDIEGGSGKGSERGRRPSRSSSGKDKIKELKRRARSISLKRKSRSDEDIEGGDEGKKSKEARGASKDMG